MKVRNTQPRLVCVGGHVNLAPGINEVADHVWLKAAHRPSKVLKFWLDEKHLEVVEPPKPEAVKAHEATLAGGETPVEPDKAARTAGQAVAGPAKTEGTTGLANLKPEKARELIADTFDRDTLEAWQKSETRKPVQDALAEQLELTKVETPKKK